VGAYVLTVFGPAPMRIASPDGAIVLVNVFEVFRCYAIGSMRDIWVVISDVLLVTRDDQHGELLHHRPQSRYAGVAGLSSACIKSGLSLDDLIASNPKLSLEFGTMVVE
jgi:hypothetical protein